MGREDTRRHRARPDWSESEDAPTTVEVVAQIRPFQILLIVACAIL